jgi:hypothetical protein
MESFEHIENLTQILVWAGVLWLLALGIRTIIVRQSTPAIKSESAHVNEKDVKPLPGPRGEHTAPALGAFPY